MEVHTLVQELLFEHLQVIITRALAEPASLREHSISECVCKAAEVDVTLRKHLLKEEEQLFPLLLQHFTFAEQAELVVQFVCCIPILAVKSVLSWLKRTSSYAEQSALRHHVTSVTADPLLSALLGLWLQPSSGTDRSAGGAHESAGSDANESAAGSHTYHYHHTLSHRHPGIVPPSCANSFEPGVDARAVAVVGAQLDRPACALEGARSDGGGHAVAQPPATDAATPHDPLDHILCLHNGILLTLRALMQDVLSIQATGWVRFRSDLLGLVESRGCKRWG